MPALLAYVRSGRSAETNDDIISFFPRMHAKAVSKSLFHRKLLGTDENFASRPQRLDASRDKSADVLAQMVIGEEKPFPINICQVIGINYSLVWFGLAGFAVRDGELLLLSGRFGQSVKDLQIDDRFRARAKGNRLLPISK